MSKPENKAKRSSQGQLILFDGMKLSTMFKFFQHKPSLHWKRAPRIITLPFFCAYNSVMGSVENLIWGRRIRETAITHPPIFILGYWRSGTTLLHNLMTIDPRHTYPSLYQTVFPWHFLTTQKVATSLTSWMVPKSRPMDNVAVSWDAPQEDDVALCAMCLVSPYMLLARPFDTESWTQSFRIEDLPDSERQAWEHSITLLMKKITVQHDKPIVLKSPAHTYRVQALTRLFPNAKFVYIQRNPYDVFNSSMHLRHAMIEENTLGKAVHPNIENSVIDTYLQAYHSYEENKHRIAPGNLCEVKYEELAADPMGELEKIYTALNLGGFDEVKARLEPQLDEHRRYQKNRFAPDSHWQKEVYERCREMYDRFDYPPPSDSETAAA